MDLGKTASKRFKHQAAETDILCIDRQPRSELAHDRRNE